MASSAKPCGPPDTVPRNNAPSLDPLGNGGSLPLLVRMPDGERHQVDIPSNASVRDLKQTIASSLPPSVSADGNSIPWDLDFNGSVLNENHTLDHYNIPDAYDHANGLLKTISDSGYMDPDKKVEALDKAYAVVQGISRGERDMERLINAVFDEADDTLPLESPVQPSLTSVRRTRRSRIPSLNFDHLAPVGAPPPLKGPKSALPSAPPTPSELIRRMSNFRPDLYDPKVVANATAPFLATPPALSNPMSLPSVPLSASEKLQKQHRQLVRPPPSTLLPVSQPASTLPAPTIPTVQSSSALASAPAVSTAPSIPHPPPAATAEITSPADGHTNEGGGELKRKDTWFTEVISNFGNSVLNVNSQESDDDDDNLGDSEGEEGDAFAKVESEDAAKDSKFAKASHASNPSPVKMEPNSDIINANGTSIADSGALTDDQKSIATDTTSRQDGTTNDNAFEGRDVITDVSGPRKVTETSSSTLATKTTANGTKPQKPQSQIIGLEPDIPYSTVPTKPVKIPKKRGRKRKNPHLSEEERKAQRQAQNRESAKLSRIRRRNMTMEYEKRVNTLEGENESLRGTVEALTDRLEMLQNLLTISVQKRPMPNEAIEQLASAQQAAAGAATASRMMGASGGMAGHTPGVNSINAGGGFGLGVGSLGFPDSLAAPTLDPVATSRPPASGPLPSLDFNQL